MSTIGKAKALETRNRAQDEEDIAINIALLLLSLPLKYHSIEAAATQAIRACQGCGFGHSLVLKDMMIKITDRLL